MNIVVIALIVIVVLAAIVIVLAAAASKQLSWMDPTPGKPEPFCACFEIFGDNRACQVPAHRKMAERAEREWTRRYKRNARYFGKLIQMEQYDGHRAADARKPTHLEERLHKATKS